MYKDLPVGATIGGLEIWHEGNHGEMGNPHPQYRFPVFKTGTSGGTSQMYYFKIIDKEFCFDINEDKRFNRFTTMFHIAENISDSRGQIAGLVTLVFSVRYDKTINASANFTPMNFRNYHAIPDSNYINTDLIRMYVSTIDSTKGIYRVRVYLSTQYAYAGYYIRPWYVEFTRGKYDDFSQPELFLNHRSPMDHIKSLFINNAQAETSSTLPTVDANTFLVPYTDSQTHYILTNLPTAQEFFRGKFVTVPSSINPNRDDTFVCHKKDSGYEWKLVTDPNRIAISLNTTETTIDVTLVKQVNLLQPSPTTITGLINGVEGQEITFVGFNGNTTLKHIQSSSDPTTMRLKGGVDATIPLNGVITLRFTTGRWYEVSRNF